MTRQEAIKVATEQNLMYIEVWGSWGSDDEVDYRPTNCPSCAPLFFLTRDMQH